MRIFFIYFLSTILIICTVAFLWGHIAAGTLKKELIDFLLGREELTEEQKLKKYRKELEKRIRDEELTGRYRKYLQTHGDRRAFWVDNWRDL